jgi:hypothetical protein
MQQVLAFCMGVVRNKVQPAIVCGSCLSESVDSWPIRSRGFAATVQQGMHMLLPLPPQMFAILAALHGCFVTHVRLTEDGVCSEL